MHSEPPEPPSPSSTKAELEKWINELEEERSDDNALYCFKESIADDGSIFLTCLATANLIQNARRVLGEEFLSIDGQFSITVEGFAMHVLGTCDVAHRLLPIDVWVATSERKAITAPFLKAVISCSLVRRIILKCEPKHSGTSPHTTNGPVGAIPLAISASWHALKWG